MKKTVVELRSSDRQTILPAVRSRDKVAA